MTERRSWMKGLCLAALVLAILLFGVYGEGFDAREFVYFRF